MGILAERWRDIPEHPGYQASNLGRIRSVDRIISRSNGVLVRYRGKVLQPDLHPKTGYFQIRLGRRGKNLLLHRLLAKVWKPNPDAESLEVNHDDGNKLNNAVSNLTWMTPLQNMRDAYAKDLIDHRGSKNGNAKLAEDSVREIRQLMVTVKRKELAKRYSVHVATIDQIRKQKSWSHIL